MSKKEAKPDPPGKLVNTQQTEAYHEQLRVYTFTIKAC